MRPRHVPPLSRFAWPFAGSAGGLEWLGVCMRLRWRAAAQQDQRAAVTSGSTLAHGRRSGRMRKAFSTASIAIRPKKGNRRSSPLR